MAADGTLESGASDLEVHRRQDAAGRVRVCGAIYVAAVGWLLAHRSFVHESSKYAKVNYLGHMKMTLNEEFDEEGRSFMDMGMKMQFGENNVSFDKKTNSYSLHKESSMIAFQEEGASNWYLLENNKEYKGLFEMLVPDEVAEKLKL